MNNILLHSYIRCGSHRFVDLMLLNNDWLTVENPNIKNSSVFEWWLVPEWANRQSMIDDLNQINDNGKKWIVKSLIHFPIIDHMDRNLDFTEMGLIRLSLSDSIESCITSHISQSYHIINNSEPNIEQSLFDINLEQIYQFYKHYITRVTNSYYYSLTKNKTTGMPLISYEEICNKTELFDITDNTTIFDGKGGLIERTTRHKTPKSTKRDEIKSLIQSWIPDEIVDSLNIITDYNFEK